MQPGDGGWARWGSAVDWMSHVVNSFESTWYLKKIQLFSDHFQVLLPPVSALGPHLKCQQGWFRDIPLDQSISEEQEEVCRRCDGHLDLENLMQPNATPALDFWAEKTQPSGLRTSHT